MASSNFIQEDINISCNLVGLEKVTFLRILFKMFCAGEEIFKFAVV